ncbi:MAG TPA: YggS family pyridoxal phosphate-dependent enzyme [Pyrinomonadaceae bacterium]|nr:YggS family pyridoxal phosphate-dependent enzyme [Pyrinomonadaceae bacterium]
MMAEAFERADDLRARLEAVRRRIDAAARRAGRDPREVTLIAVTKTHPAAVVREAIAAGARDLGENRVQEAAAKVEELGDEARAARWHLIGHLQSNKARRAAELFDCVHSVDDAALVRRLERICAELGRERLDALVQVDLAGEATKEGVAEAALAEVIEAFAACERVRLVGLMTLPPFFDDAERARPFFRRLRELRDEWRARGAFGSEAGALSMGMTNDFEVAVEEGSTMVRVGTALFGEREAKG